MVWTLGSSKGSRVLSKTEWLPRSCVRHPNVKSNRHFTNLTLIISTLRLLTRIPRYNSKHTYYWKSKFRSTQYYNMNSYITAERRQLIKKTTHWPRLIQKEDDSLIPPYPERRRLIDPALSRKKTTHWPRLIQREDDSLTLPYPERRRLIDPALSREKMTHWPRLIQREDDSLTPPYSNQMHPEVSCRGATLLTLHGSHWLVTPFVASDWD